MMRSEDGQAAHEKAHGCHRKKGDFCPEVLGQSLKGSREERGYNPSTRQVSQETRRCWPSAEGQEEGRFQAC